MSRALRRAASVAVAGVLAATGTVVALLPASPAQAVRPTGWYMLRNTYYKGWSDVSWCLSANKQAYGPGTHYVYLATCNGNTAAQWWYFPNYAPPRIVNYANFDGGIWDLSANNSTPPGGAAGTYGAFTAQRNTSRTHNWEIEEYLPLPTFTIENVSTGGRLSASHNSPPFPGTMRVYTVKTSASPGETHQWEFYRPVDGPRGCTWEIGTCGHVD